MAEKEYIEREEVREAFRMEFDNEYADDITDRLPIANVQEVIRCQDCIFYLTDDCAMYYRSDSGEQYSWNNLTDFCSWGKKKDSEQK